MNRELAMMSISKNSQWTGQMTPPSTGKRSSPFASLTLLMLLALGAAGCPDQAPPELLIAPTTSAPPARTLRLDQRALTITVSRGVVFGLRCWDSCDGTCLGPSFVVADDKLAEVRPAFRNGRKDAEHVLIARSPGSTTVTIRDTCAEATYRLVVVDD
jgi:hypothetical protein